MNASNPSSRINKRNRVARRQRMFDEQRGICWLCGGRMQLDAPEEHNFASFDEVRPRSLGGSTKASNQVLAHKSCNERRGRLAPTDKQLKRLKGFREACPTPVSVDQKDRHGEQT
jgi:hypothetical protein